jgi:hypothetical protein
LSHVNCQKILFTDTAIGRNHDDVQTLHPYTYTLSPLGFISTHSKSDNSKPEERTVCCWSIDISAPSNPCIALVAHAVVNTLNSDVLRITHRGSAETSNLTLVLECDSGKQFSALWDGPAVLDNSPAQLQFVEELEESPLKNTDQPLVGSELPCRQSDDTAWILHLEKLKSTYHEWWVYIATYLSYRVYHLCVYHTVCTI